MTTEHKAAIAELTESDFAPWLQDDRQTGRVLGILLASLFLVLLVMTIGVAVWTQANQAPVGNPLG